MSVKLLKHQIKYAQGYKDKAFMVHEGGTGKTVCACVWLKDGRDRDAIVIVPKRIVIKWQEALKLWGTKALVVSKEQFKKIPIREYSAIVVDEADEFASPLFTKGRSQLAATLYNLVKAYPKMAVALLTATPVRSNPWNLHTLFCYLGIYVEWKDWRSKFFTLEHKPYMRHPAYFPREDWRSHMRGLLEKYADIILLKDCINDLPPVTEKVINITNEKFKDSRELTPTARFVEEHKYEQLNKPKKIIEIGKNYRKILVVAHYVEQVETLNKELSKDRLTFMVHGGVNGQEEILRKANGVDECYLVVQASLGAGFDADSFSCVIFASMSYRVRDFVQMKFRVRRIHNLHPIVYMILLSNRCDKAVYAMIQKGKDFIPSEWQ